MSNYGFKTMGKDGRTAINGKWPIFGADINHAPAAFRTIRITDRRTNSLRYGSTPLPSVNTSGTNYWQNPQAETHGEIKELVYRYEHGYQHKPVGYYTVLGNLNFRTSGDLVGQEVSSPIPGNQGGNYSASTNGTITKFPLVPTINGSFPGTYSDFGTTPALRVGSANYMPNADMLIPDNAPLSYKGVYMPVLDGEAGYTVEIDDKYVSIYRVNYWFDVRRRSYFRYNDSSTSFTYDSNIRVRGVTQLEGSVVDVNIYLTPLEMEKL